MDTQAYDRKKVVVEPLWLPLLSQTGLLLMVTSQTAPIPQAAMVAVAWPLFQSHAIWQAS